MSTNPWEVTATSGGTKTEIPPGGAHPAVFIGIVDLGTHEEEFEEKDKDGNKTGKMRKVEVKRILIGWELPTEQVAGKNGVNHTITADYSLTFSPKSNLRKMLESLRGSPYAEGEKTNIVKLLGTKCLVNLVEGKSAKGNTYVNLKSVGQLPKTMSCPNAKRTPTTWTFADGEEALAKLDWLPTFIYGERLTDLMARAKERRPVQQPGTPPVSSEDEALGEGTPVPSAPTNDPIPF